MHEEQPQSDEEKEEERKNNLGKLSPWSNIQKHVSLEDSMSISDSSDYEDEDEKNR